MRFMDFKSLCQCPDEGNWDASNLKCRACGKSIPVEYAIRQIEMKGE